MARVLHLAAEEPVDPAPRPAAEPVLQQEIQQIPPIVRIPQVLQPPRLHGAHQCDEHHPGRHAK